MKLAASTSIRLKKAFRETTQTQASVTQIYVLQRCDEFVKASVTSDQANDEVTTYVRSKILTIVLIFINHRNSADWSQRS